MNQLILAPSIIRRVVATSAMVLLGAIQLILALSSPEMAFGYKILLLLIGGAAFFVASKLWKSTSEYLIFEDNVLREQGGRVLCHLEDIDRVERSPFAFKPSNGFLVRMKEKQTRTWAPGLWWRFGKNVGIGGVTPAGQGKAMADVMAAHLMQRKLDIETAREAAEADAGDA